MFGPKPTPVPDAVSASALPPWLEVALQLVTVGHDRFFEMVDWVLGAHEGPFDRFIVGYQAVGLVLFLAVGVLKALAVMVAPAGSKFKLR